MALVSDDKVMEKLVVKGCNTIGIAYGVSNRSSADIDLSMDGNFADVEATFAEIE
jgi:hypothetical protein